MLLKENGTGKHEWIVRESMKTAADCGKNRQNVFVNEVKVCFGVHSQEIYYSNRRF
jgi:hypothetical protein